MCKVISVRVKKNQILSGIKRQPSLLKDDLQSTKRIVHGLLLWLVIYTVCF